jgi:hypothetical protein
VGAVVNEYWGTNVHAFGGEDNDQARKLAALSLETFFGPDQPYFVTASTPTSSSWSRGAAYPTTGVDQVILIMQTETIPHERALQSIEMFGKHVIPACRPEVRARPVPAAV